MAKDIIITIGARIAVGTAIRRVTGIEFTAFAAIAIHCHMAKGAPVGPAKTLGMQMQPRAGLRDAQDGVPSEHRQGTRRRNWVAQVRAGLSWRGNE